MKFLRYVLLVCSLILDSINAEVFFEATIDLPKQQSYETSYSELPTTDVIKWKRLVDWVQANGGYIDRRAVLAKSNEYGFRGMFATEDIPRDTVVVRIPAGIVLKDDQETEGFLDRIQETNRSFVSGIYSFAREWEKGTASRYHPWMDFIPDFGEYSQFHPLAILFASDDREMLAREWSQIIPSFATNLLGRLQVFESFVETCQAHNQQERLFPSHIFSTETMRQTELSRQSRMWGEHGYIPGADFFNHRYDAHVGLKKDGEDMLFVVIKDIKAGDEISHSYGVNDHIASFSSWGFCEWNKRTKFKRIQVNIEKSGTILGQAIDFMLSQQNFDTQGAFYVTEDGFGPNLHRLLRTSQLVLRDFNDLMIKNEHDPAGLLDREVVSIENEARTIAKGIELAKESRKEYPKTLEEYKIIARDSKDYVVSMLAKIAVEDIETLESFERKIRQQWNNFLKV